MLPSVSAADLRGAARLATEAAVGVARVAEGVHQAVWQTLGVPAVVPGHTRGLAGHVYAAVRGVTRLVGGSVERGLAQLPETMQRAPDYAAWRAALNGVLGDHLAATGNPLATPMALRLGRQTLCEAPAEAIPVEVGPFDVPATTRRVVLLVHGLCMDDRAWEATELSGPSHATALAALGYTPVAVRYNTGMPIAENGRSLAVLLSALHDRWPVPLDEIAVVAHSMGGLVARSAVHHAEATGEATGEGWRQALTRVVFLGTPHHGAPLERAGRWVDIALGASRFSAPFAAIGSMRSAGITDLRHGRVTDGDTPPPLPSDVACYAIAATLAGRRTALADHLVGDGLVPLRSALGQHADPHRALSFAPAHTHVAYGHDHFALLRDAAVTQRLVAWLAGPAAS
ncbi:MAG: alpha/beta hydrolase [Bacteroidota bacterium]